MTTHDLKILPEYFDAVADGRKTFEMRKNDRDFREGDWLKLREWEPASIENATPAQYTGQRCLRRVSYVLDGGGTPYPVKTFGSVVDGPTTVLAKGYVILGLSPPLTELGCKLKGRRLFYETVDPKEAMIATSYLNQMTSYVERAGDAQANAVKPERLPEVVDARQAIHCLLLEVDASIQADVSAKVEAAFALLGVPSRVKEGGE